ncbi:M18 family aminopeptidase [Propionibacterium freudenreichii]|uniref:M18 family aminopeptidase n=1 Tax=Propionibacterium freudenreichii TaxID=1744 RepID=UPI0005427380|nr:Aminopeptidase [Propionibacterium freudenreichii]SBN50736.1 M18 family aminopeptidase [Propionibacterium freudenreichii]
MATMADPSEFMTAFAQFISSSPTSYHAAETMSALLDRAGFEAMDEKLPWTGVAGRRYFVRGGAVVAWIAPERVEPTTGFRIVGVHTDSPALKLKPEPVYDNAGWQQLNMEVYGGPLINSWLDRELGLAGRITTRTGENHLVRTGPIMRVSQLAPHLDRSVNQALTVDQQYELMPSYGLGSEPDVIELLCGQTGILPTEFGFADVYAYPTQEPALFGNQSEFFASSRLDNLSSVFPGLLALLRVKSPHDVVVFSAFDHEEVGSSTTSGAAGPLLSDALTRIAAGLEVGGDAYQAMLARSSCISADAAHSVNPNHVSKYDPVVRPLMNQGPALKVNAKQRYATDSVTASLWLRACEAAGVVHQSFVSNNDVPCGTTIGPITATRLGIPTVDVGVPILSMHSTREMCGSQDPQLLSRALEAYWMGA